MIIKIDSKQTFFLILWAKALVGDNDGETNRKENCVREICKIG